MKFVCKFDKRRGVSETIGTLMILVVTVVGAVFISNFMQDLLLTVDQTPGNNDVRPASIILTGYDTRDSTNLSDVIGLDNKFDQFLCSAGQLSTPCDVNKNELPLDATNGPGTDFIVLHIRNTGLNSVFLQSVMINNVGHTWDTSTAMSVLTLTPGYASGKYPAAGKFSIIPIANDTPIPQQATNELPPDGEVRLVIKLSDQIPQDIVMWHSMRILVNYGGPQPAEFVILSGDAKW